MFTKTAVVSLFAGLAAAQLHPAVGDVPVGNPISRPLTEVVPACKPFTITWQPTTPNTVSVLLVKGPPTNVVKFGPSLAEGLPNSGSLSWTPSADLEATTGPAGYGIQIIDDVTGQYQYSNQFGISKADCAQVSVSSGKPSSQTGYPTSSAQHSVYPTANSTTSASPKTTGYPTASGSANSTVVLPTKSMTVPSTLKPTTSGSATTSKLPEATSNSASAVQAGLGFAGAAVAFAFML